MKLFTYSLVFPPLVDQAVYRLRRGAAAGANALATSATLSGYVSASCSFSVGQSRDLGKSNENANLFKLFVVSLTLASAQNLREDTAGYTVGMWHRPNDQILMKPFL